MWNLDSNSHKLLPSHWNSLGKSRDRRFAVFSCLLSMSISLSLSTPNPDSLFFPHSAILFTSLQSNWLQNTEPMLYLLTNISETFFFKWDFSYWLENIGLRVSYMKKLCAFTFSGKKKKRSQNFPWWKKYIFLYQLPHVHVNNRIYFYSQ